MLPASPHPYEDLTPDVVLDAMASVGLNGDGRLTALSSYENRVYQAGLEAPAGETTALAVVLKFYRPGRWSDAQILEEHGFAAELLAAEARKTREAAAAAAGSNPTGTGSTDVPPGTMPTPA